MIDEAVGSLKGRALAGHYGRASNEPEPRLHSISLARPGTEPIATGSDHAHAERGRQTGSPASSAKYLLAGAAPKLGPLQRQSHVWDRAPPGASIPQASGFRGDVTVFRLNANAGRLSGLESAFRRNTRNACTQSRRS